MLLDDFSQEQLDEIRDYVYEEVTDSEGSREEFTNMLQKWEDQYDGKKKPKNFPFEKCSNIKIPFTSSNVDAIVARIFNSIFAQSDFWMAEPLMEGSYDGAKELQDFLRYASDHVLNIKTFCRDWFFSMTKLGTGIGKVYWDEKHQYHAVKMPNGTVDFESRLRYRGPKVECVSLHDFLRPVGYADIQEMPWCGNRFRLNYIQLKQRESDGVYKNLDQVLRSPETSVHEVDEQRAANVGYEVNSSTDPKHGVFEFWEISLLWLVKDRYIPVLLVMHPQTKTVVFLDYYPYKHCRWPYVSLPFLPREKQLEGIGVCAMLADVQEGLDTMVNQGIDNATLANSRVFLANRSITMNKSMRFFPGAVIPVNNKDDVVPLQMADIYSSNYNLAQMIQGYGERRSGLNEYLLGRENSAVGTKATATGTVALIQEGSRRFDFILLNVREASQEIAYQCLELWEQYAEGGIPYLYEPQETIDEMFQEMADPEWRKFAFPEGFDIREQYRVELSASKASLNKEVEKQNLLNLFGLVDGYYKEFLGLVGQVSNPQAPPAFKEAGIKVANAGAELLRRIVETCEIKDSKMLIPKMEDLNGLKQQLSLPGGQPGAMGALPPPAGGQPVMGIRPGNGGEAGAGIPGLPGDLRQLGGLPG